MMQALEVLFWLCATIILYVYMAYPLLLLVFARLRPNRPVRMPGATPTVSIIIAAYNEEKCICGKMENTLAVDYPKDRLEAIVVSDGSTDGTNDIVRGHEAKGIRLVALKDNSGKSAAQNAGVAEAFGDLLFFTDANVKLRPNAILEAVACFADARVGCVVGKVTYVNQGDTAVTEGEGMYWRYELFLRRMESELGNLAMASGPVMAIRRELFQPLDPNVGEDFVLPMQVAMGGYRVVYEPLAVSEEILFQDRLGSMLRTKVRIISKDLRGLILCRPLLNPLRYPLFAWGLISHKLLRWLVPYFLLVNLLICLLLRNGAIYQLVLGLQISVYVLALAGYLWQRKGKPPRILGIPFSFCLVNLAALIGVARYAIGHTAGRWEPTR